MKRLLLSALALISFNALAQDLPQPSPFTTLEQRVGLTDFTVEYSRPAARGREIYGNLVPYGKLWRTGANKATAISFNTPVSINGVDVEAGKYSIFSIPNEGEWTFILNSNTELYGTNGYEESKDVLRFNVAEGDYGFCFSESFHIGFDAVDGGKAKLIISWAGKGIAIPIRVNVEEKAMENIENALSEATEEDMWRVKRNAGAYYLRDLKKPAEGLAFIQDAVKLKPDNWYNYYMLGEAQYANGNKKEALAAADKAMEVGLAEAKKAGAEFGYTDMVNEAKENWSK